MLNGVDYCDWQFLSPLDITKSTCFKDICDASDANAPAGYPFGWMLCGTWRLCIDIFREKHAVFQCVGSMRLCFWTPHCICSLSIHIWYYKIVSEAEKDDKVRRQYQALGFLGDVMWTSGIGIWYIQPLWSTLCIRDWPNIGHWSAFSMGLPSYR